MKANRVSLERSLDQPDSAVRLYLFYGPNSAGSLACAERLLSGLAARKLTLSSSTVRSDPAQLWDQAAAMGLFGDRKAIWIDPGGDEITAAAESMLGGAAIESPTIVIAGELRKTSSLLKLAEAHSAALCHVSYPLDQREADRVVLELGRAEGVRMTVDVASRIAAATGNDQAMIASEIRKYADYLDASRDAPREIDHDLIDRLGADVADSGWSRVGDLSLTGQRDALAEQLQRLPQGGAEIVPTVRVIQRRILQVAALRARVDSGERLDAVMTSLGKSLFWRDKPIVQGLVSRWSAARLTQLASRFALLERRSVLSSIPAEAALGEELIAVARAVFR